MASISALLRTAMRGDVQAARYHPLQEKAQSRLAGRVALGQPID